MNSTNAEIKKPNKFQDSLDYLNQKIYTLVDHIKKTNPEKPNLISHLMKAKDPDSGEVGLPEKQIRDEIMIFSICCSRYHINCINMVIGLSCNKSRDSR